MPPPSDENRGQWRTSDLRLAAIARAAGGRLVDIDSANPGRVVFVYADLRPDFDLAVMNREVTVNAQDVLAAFEGVHGLLANLRRGR
jgi:hypothetical protein